MSKEKTHGDATQTFLGKDGRCHPIKRFVCGRFKRERLARTHNVDTGET